MVIHLHDYDSHYHPAMPMIEVRLQRRSDEAGMTVKAIVDSGSDGTIIPLRYLHSLKARKGRTTWLSSVGARGRDPFSFSPSFAFPLNRLLNRHRQLGLKKLKQPLHRGKVMDLPGVRVLLGLGFKFYGFRFQIVVSSSEFL
jgi:hypothetical protein